MKKLITMFLILGILLTMMVGVNETIAATTTKNPTLFGLKWGMTPKECEKAGVLIMSQLEMGKKGVRYIQFDPGLKIGDVDIHAIGLWFTHKNKLNNIIACF